MRRLTNKKEADTQRREYENRLKNGYPRNIPEERFLKLASYEDTGVDPNDIVEVQNALGDIPFGRFHDIMEAERGGRLMILPPNAPLTLEELREMDGEPVWVEIPTNRVFEWCIAKFDPLMNRVRLWCSGGGWFDGRNVGKSLFVYRHKPETMKGRIGEQNET